MKTPFLRRAALLLPIAALAACSDLTGDAGDSVAGLSIESGGSELVSVSGASVSGAVTVQQNGQRALDIVLRGANGGAVGLGLSETVRVTIVNTGVASYTGGESGTLRGNQRGSTTMRVDVLNAGTAVYTSPAIPIQVN